MKYDFNTDETVKFPSAVALVWRWTGDNDFRDELYDFAKRNMHYVVERLDDDGDGWPEGSGNVERGGMGVEKLDNSVYLIRGLFDLADMARSKGDAATFDWANGLAEGLRDEFEDTWWFPAGRSRSTRTRSTTRPSAGRTTSSRTSTGSASRRWRQS